MAQHASAEKRNRQNQARKARNTALRSRMRTAIKTARSAIAAKSADLDAEVKAAVSNINRAATKGVIAKETAQRYISRIMRSAAAPGSSGA